MSEMIRYTKEQMLPVRFSNMPLSGIPVAEQKPMNTFQRFVVLALQKGFAAEDFEHLSIGISKAFNIKESFVRSFLQTIQSQLEYDGDKGVYHISEDLAIIKDKFNPALWFLQTQQLTHRYDNLLYSSCFGCIIDKASLPEKELFFETVETEITQQELSMYMRLHMTDIHQLVATSKEFRKKYALLDPFYCTLDTDTRISTVEYQIPVLVQYEFDSSRARAVDAQISPIIKNVHLPDLQNEAITRFAIDTELPTFIEYMGQMRKDAISEEKRDSILSVVENAVRSSKEKDAEVRGRKCEVERLTDEYNKTIRDIYSFDVDKQADNLYAQLVYECDEVKTAERQLSTLVMEEKTAREQLKSVTIEQEWRTNVIHTVCSSIPSCGVIELTYTKYSDEDNRLHGKVQRICAGIAFSVDAIMYQSMESVYDALGSIRDSYRSTFKAIFDTLLNEQRRSVGAYFSDSQLISKLRGVIPDFESNTISMLKKVDDILNAIGHVADGLNEKLRKQNVEALNEFEDKSRADKIKLLVAVCEFFHSLSLTDTQLTTVNNILSYSTKMIREQEANISEVIREFSTFPTQMEQCATAYIPYDGSIKICPVDNTKLEQKAVPVRKGKLLHKLNMQVCNQCGRYFVSTKTAWLDQYQMKCIPLYK